MTALLLFSMVLAGFAGAICHELAHWVVWKVAGRNPKLDLWGLTVYPRKGPPITTAWDRLAAAAPYVFGTAVLAWGAVAWKPVVFMFGLAMVQIPSQVDIEAIRGRVEWEQLITHTVN